MVLILQKRMRRDRDGIVALFDAIMFFIIMLILSTTFLFFSTLASDNTDAYLRGEMMTYADETNTALMASTLPEVYYNITQQDGTIDTIDRELGNTKVEYLLLEELGLLDDGVDQSGFIDGYEGKIHDLADRLISVRYHYAILATYTNGTSGDRHMIFLTDVDGLTSDAIPRNETIAQNWEQPMLHPEKVGQVQIQFTLWRAW